MAFWDSKNQQDVSTGGMLDCIFKTLSAVVLFMWLWGVL